MCQPAPQRNMLGKQEVDYFSSIKGESVRNMCVSCTKKSGGLKPAREASLGFGEKSHANFSEIKRK